MYSYGGGGDHSAYWAALEKKREEERQEALARQAAIDAEADPLKRRAMRREDYSCGDKFIQLEDLTVWPKDAAILKCLPNNTTVKDGGGGSSFFRNDSVTYTKKDLQRRYEIDAEFNGKVALFQGDICRLELDGVVNAANSSLMGGGGIDGAIHSAAGPLLDDACRKLKGCETGETKITKGFYMPAEYILHTVGPMGRGDRQLRGCYKTCLALAEKHKLKTVAFCCVGTGIFGFPLVRATHIALEETRKWFQTLKDRKANKAARNAEGAEATATAEVAAPKTSASEDTTEEAESAATPESDYTIDDVERIVFCVFRDVERQAYEKMMPGYFPCEAGFPVETYVAEPGDDDFNRDDAMTYGSEGGYGGYGGLYAMRGSSEGRGGNKDDAAQ